MLRTECIHPKTFESFGRSRWSVVSRRPLEQLTLSLDLKQTRADIRQAVPVTPGVYGMIDAEGDANDLDASILVASWFRHRGQELAQTLLPDHATEICRAMIRG